VESTHILLTSNIPYLLASVFLPVWRTSTPEPTQTGIIWTYIKDVTRYIPLFAKPGTLILDLNNLLTQSLTGQYDGMLTSVYPSSS
jgi:Peptide N-acetyl-beta-D-glucosaminyl asparaginase amidase A